MRGKAALIIGLATGYVLGTRDGRARYQQIKTQFDRIISDPRVQEKTAQAADLAKAKAPLVKDKLSDVTDKATSKVGSGSGSDSPSSVDLPAQTTTSAPDLTHGPSGISGDTGLSSAAQDAVDEDAIILTPPSPSPLATEPTQTNSSNPTTGGPNG